MDEKEKLFLQLIDSFEWKCDVQKYKNSLFGFKNDICLFEIYISNDLNQKKIIANYRFGFEQDLKNALFLFNNAKIWSVFEERFDMKYNDVKSFMNGMVEEHFKMKAVTGCKALNNNVKVEEYFKMKGFTTRSFFFFVSSSVEEHLKKII